MNLQKKYTTELKHDIVEALHAVITKLLTSDYNDDDDKLMMCNLAEVKDRLYIKMAKYQTKYKITFTSSQAIAIRLMFTSFLSNSTNQLTNKLHTISTEVHRYYSEPN